MAKQAKPPHPMGPPVAHPRYGAGMPGPAMQRTHERQTPLTQAELAEARAREAARKQWDPGYVTAAEARSIPPEALDANPELKWRVERSQPDWPENRMSATEALGPLAGGCGETVEVREIPTESLFGGAARSDASAVE
jgi:hypothetical protein